MQKIQYYQPTHFDNCVFSCDGVRIKFQVDTSNNLYQEFFSEFFGSLRIDIENYPVSIKFATYKYLAKINYGDDATMTIGFCFNGAQKLTDSGWDNDVVGMLDFNLNKVGEKAQFWEDYRFIKSCSRIFEIQRVDFALDIPVKRENVILQKDRRVYESYVRSNENKTEWLGTRNSIGRVKVYNKQIESGLDNPLTRIEVTSDLNFNSYIENFPKVYNLEERGQLNMSILDLSISDRAILDMENELIIHGLDDGLLKFDRLSYHKKQKLKDYLLPEFALVLLLVLNNKSLIMSAIERYKVSMQV